MTIAIIGGGLTGLTAAYELLKAGHRVTVFEKEKTLGGLTGGFKDNMWNWSLEYFYHHFFTNDKTLIDLAKELGLEKDILIMRPITATLVQKTGSNKQKTIENTLEECGEQTKFCAASLPLQDGPYGKKSVGTEDASKFSFATKAFQKNNPNPHTIYQLNSPMNLLTFPLLSPLDKLRTAALLAFCKLNPFWQPLEKITAETFFKTIGGSASWRILWEPLMKGKFGHYANSVPASWLWARFHKRTMRLGYFRGGFQTFVDGLEKAIKKQGGVIHTNADVKSIHKPLAISHQLSDFSILYVSESRKLATESFDKVLLTTPSSTTTKLLSSLTNNRTMQQFNNNALSIPHLYAQTLILETKEPILDKTYWLNIMDPSFPFIAVVAHTNMVDKKHYGDRHITYIGNYLPEGHPFLKMTKQQLLKKFLPYLKKINPSFNFNFQISNFKLCAAYAAQPVHTLNYSKKAPSLQTPISNIYLANLDSIYPWDRGTNYAVELGKRAARSIQNNS